MLNKNMNNAKQENYKRVFHSGGNILYFLQWYKRESSGITPPRPTLGLMELLNLSHQTAGCRYLIVVLVRNSLVDHRVDHLIRWCLHLYVLCEEASVQICCPFLVKLFVFILWLGALFTHSGYKSFVNITWANIFPVNGLCFHCPVSIFPGTDV